MCQEKEIKKEFKFNWFKSFVEKRNGKPYAIVPIESDDLKDGSRIKGSLKIDGAMIPLHKEIIISVKQNMIGYKYIYIPKDYWNCFPDYDNIFELWIDDTLHWVPAKLHYKRLDNKSGRMARDRFYADNPTIKEGSKLKITIDKLWEKYTLSLIVGRPL